VFRLKLGALVPRRIHRAERSLDRAGQHPQYASPRRR
jgi:hypothetical protein